MSGSIQTNFVNTYLPLAQQQSSITGVPANVILAVAAQESGWGTSSVANTQNNFFGISVHGSGTATYASPSDGFSAFGNLINNQYPGVSSVAAGGGSASDIANALVAGGYNTVDPSYASTITGLAGQINGIIGNQTGTSGSTPTASTIGAGSGTATGAATGAASTAATDSGILSTLYSPFTSAYDWLIMHVATIMFVILGAGIMIASIWLFKGDAVAPPAIATKALGSGIRRVGKTVAKAAVLG